MIKLVVLCFWQRRIYWNEIVSYFQVFSVQSKFPFLIQIFPLSVTKYVKWQAQRFSNLDKIWRDFLISVFRAVYSISMAGWCLDVLRFSLAVIRSVSDNIPRYVWDWSSHYYCHWQCAMFLGRRQRENYWKLSVRINLKPKVLDSEL